MQVKDLNANRSLPYPDGAFDAVTCALSFQYMQHPEEVVAELGRVMKPGGVCIVSFSNRMFPSKAIYAWRQRSDRQRLALVRDYFRSSPAFPDPAAVDRATPLHALSYLRSILAPPSPPPPPRTKWTRRVLHPVLIGHAASLTPSPRALVLEVDPCSHPPSFLPLPAVPSPSLRLRSCPPPPFVLSGHAASFTPY